MKVCCELLMCALILAAMVCSGVSAADKPVLPDASVFGAGVRPTEPLSPEDEQKQFILPPGFEIQLVAAEPQISKPMNLAFDARGRLWVTDTLEYPFPGPIDKPGRDTIRILEDTDGDGRSDKVTTFADGLNIPIGLYPYGDGVIAYSIPFIWYLRDTDGDGKCDKREKLYGPMGWERDTHGMCNAFTRGFDGWLYSCHGFNNHTTVAGKDGHQITMISGNTFRMRLDGSRVEHYTKGQVNPFGMSFDAAGDLFTADCHTKPVTLLLRNGCYESFGRPHDGIGFVPNVMDHLHGSTAIAGIAIWTAPGLPAEYAGDTYGGNVMTSRINRNSLVYAGSSIRAKEESDLVISADPWFRPVDLKIGPDGAMYVADFYNKIIGHYEVPLPHPGRDRFRGRIWRIVYRGDSKPDPLKTPDLTSMTLEQLLVQLGSPTQSLRMLVADRIVDHFGKEAIDPIKACLQRNGITETESKLLGGIAKSTLELRRVHLLWLLMRLNAASPELMQKAVADESSLVRQQAFRVLEALEVAPEGTSDWLLKGFADPEPRVRRAAVMAASKHPSAKLLSGLIELADSTPAEDAHLRHAARMALRDHLQSEAIFPELDRLKLSTAQTKLIADVCMAVDHAQAAAFLVRHITSIETTDRDRLSQLMKVAARQASGDGIAQVADVASQRFADDPVFQFELLEAMRQGLQQRGENSPAVREWAIKLTLRLLNSDGSAEPIGWSFSPHPGTPDRGNPWTVQNRPMADGKPAWPVWSSFPRGEQWTGLFRSGVFNAPPKFSFWVCGHAGFPTAALKPVNFVRLRDAATHELLKEVPPPRNDTAQKVEWDLSSLNDRPVYVELVDGDTDTAYAWLAAGRFSIESLNPSRAPEERRLAALLISGFKLNEVRDPARQQFEKSVFDPETARSLGQALVSLEPDGRLAALAEVSGQSALSLSVRQRAVDAIAKRLTSDAADILIAALQSATAPQQVVLAEQLASDAPGATLLIDLAEKGKASASLLQRPTVEARLSGLKDQKLKDRIAALVKDLPAEAEQVTKLIEQRRALVLSRPGTASIGAELFKKNCQACHQIAGQGQKVGPNLDGIGARGPDRLIEDILAPNRNVDVAFRATNVVTKDGRVINGLIRRKEGQQLVLVDGKGMEVTIPVSDIDEQIATKLSPMPAGFAETVSDDDFRHLIAYLLTVRPPE